MPTILELFSSKQIETPNGLSETAEKSADSQKKSYTINNVATDGTDISGPIRAFNTLQLKDGKTAAFTTNVNNRPFSKIETKNIFLKNTSFPLVNKLKASKLAQKDGESFLEEELTGLRPLQLLSQPVLYGTDIVKITAKEAKSTEKMKLGTYDYETAVQVAKTIQPTIYTPTGLFLNDEFRKGKIIQKPKLFSKLRGTPEQLLLQLALHPIDALKKLTSPKGITPNKTNTTSNTQIVVRNNNFSKNGTPVELLRYLTLSFDTDDLKYTKQLKKDSNVELNDRNDLAGKLNEILNGKTITDENDPNFLTQGYDKKILTGNGFIYDFDKSSLTKREKSKYTGNIKTDGNGVVAYKYTSTLLENKTDARGNKVFSKDLSLEAYRGMNTFSDELNSKTILEPTDDVKLANDKTLDDYDFAPLKFYSVATKKSVRFRATISGLSETFTPSWESNKFVGNPFSFYTYSGIERSVTFTFKVFSLNYEEHKAAWTRLSFLSSLVYPQSYVNLNYVTPPFIEFSLGDMYRNKPAFIESLTYTIDDNSPWETGLEQVNVAYESEDPTTPQVKDYYISALTQKRDNKESYLLPKFIEVAMTLKLVETPGSTHGLTDSNKGVKVLYAMKEPNFVGNILSKLPVQEKGADKAIAGATPTSTPSASGGAGGAVTGAPAGPVENKSSNTAQPGPDGGEDFVPSTANSAREEDPPTP